MVFQGLQGGVSLLRTLGEPQIKTARQMKKPAHWGNAMIKHLVSMVVGIAGAAILALFPNSAFADKRVALVIGNSAYENVSKLPNPARDANSISQMFKNAGFDTVIMEHDVGNLAFKRAIRKFEDASADADIAVVFYAGHGIEIQGVNYLVPVDAKLASDRDARDEAISLERLIDSVESVGKPKRLRLIILDACRDNPFVRNMKRQRQAALRSITAGLGAVEPTGSDTLIAYAAKGGSVAEDGEGNNSPFTTALLKSLTVPGLDIRLAFGRVRDDVMKLTNRKQEPFVYGSLGGGNISLVPAPAQQPVEADASKVKADYELVNQIGSKKAWEVFIATYKTGFYVDLAKAQLTKLAALEPQTAPSSAAKPSSDEARAWSNIQQSNDPVALQKFIERYPNSPLALNAQNRLSMLERNARDREETARLEREAALKRADDERRGRETAQQRAEDERRLKAAKSEREKAELQASLKREEDERRAAADQRRAELQAQVKRAEDDRRAKQAEAERQKAALHAALQPPQSSSSLPPPRMSTLPPPQATLPPPQATLPPPQASLQPPQDTKPAAPPSNTPDLVIAAQKQLTRIGCYSGEASGSYNDATKLALRRYMVQRGRPATEVAITDDFVSELDNQKARVCPLVCPSGQTVSGETCVVSKPAPAPAVSKRDEGKNKKATKREEKKENKKAAKREENKSQQQSNQPRPAPRASSSAVLGVGF